MSRFIFPLFLLCSPLFSQTEEAAVVQLRETISKIVDVQTTESEERTEWKSTKSEFAALLELHARELKLLDEELAKAGNSATGHEETTAEMKSKIEALKKARSLTSEAVARNIQRINEISKRFPAPLLKEAETELANLRNWKPADEPRDALRSILDVLGKAEQFNRRLTRTTEILEGREVEVLYLGLGQAYYMDRKDKAGVGQPGTSQWEWKSQPDIRAELTKAFETLDKKRPPTMVTLPLEIR